MHHINKLVFFCNLYASNCYIAYSSFCIGSSIRTYDASLSIVQIVQQERRQIRQIWPAYRDTDSAPLRMEQYTFSLAALGHGTD